jgi:anti-sigma B factor antagonist
MLDALELSSHTEPSGVQVFRLVGRLDSRSTPRFVRECPAPNQPGAIVVVNLSGLTFMSSSGVGALLAHSEQARENGAEFRIAEPAPVVTSTIHLLNLDEYLNVYATEDEAARRAA